MDMNTSKNNTVRGLWDELNQGIFPWIDDNIGELDGKHRLFMAVCEAVVNPREFDYAKWKGNGRPPCSRLKIFKAFLLKAVLNVQDTKEFVRMIRAEPLSRRLCGWDSPGLVPSQSRFSRVFGEFAERGFTDAWFAEMIVKYLADAAYDAEPIREACAELGTVAVIDANPRRSAGARTMGELGREVYKDRGAAERFFSHLLESHGGRTVRVRAPAKVALHLLLGAIVVAVEQMLRMLC